MWKKILTFIWFVVMTGTVLIGEIGTMIANKDLTRAFKHLGFYFLLGLILYQFLVVYVDKKFSKQITDYLFYWSSKKVNAMLKEVTKKTEKKDWGSAIPQSEWN